MIRFIYPLILVVTISGCSATITSSESVKRFRIGASSLCVSSELSVKKMKISGALGTAIGADTRGIFIALPQRQEGDSEPTDDLVVFVRPAGAVERELPNVDERQAEPVIGIAGLSVLPMDEQIRSQKYVALQHQSLIGRFSAVCRNLAAYQKCSRSFRYGGIVGSYSFDPAALPSWSKMDDLVAESLRLNRIALCRKRKS